MFLTKRQINKLGIRYIGKDVQISDKAVFYNPRQLYIGDYSRIDDFVIISAPCIIRKYVHVGCYASIVGKAFLVMDDYSGISSRVSVFTSGDSYDGEYMTNPCVPEAYRNTHHSEVHLGRHVVVGAGSVILPGVLLSHGVAVGAMSLVNTSQPPDKIVAGVPAKVIKDRKLNIYNLEKQSNEKIFY